MTDASPQSSAEARVDETAFGRVTWHCSEEGGGPALWVGEITRCAYSETGLPDGALDGDGGWWLSIYDPEHEALAKFVDGERAREFFDRFANLLTASATALASANAELDSARAEIATLREALAAILDHSCVADSAPEDKFAEDHDAERKARAALARLRSATPSADLRAEKCRDCGIANPVWFAPNDLWNLVIGGPEAKDDPGGIICPICFIKRAEAKGITPTAWKLYHDDALASPQPDAVAKGEAPKTDLHPGWWLKCKVTGNECGTDTWEINHPCQCENCQKWLRRHAPSSSPEVAPPSGDAATQWKLGDPRCDRCDNGINEDWCYCPYCGYPQAEYMNATLTRRAAAEKMREAVVAWHEARELAIRNNPLGREGLHTGIQGAHMAAHRESAEYFRALPLPPDAAAETKEMG